MTCLPFAGYGEKEESRLVSAQKIQRRRAKAVKHLSTGPLTSSFADYELHQTAIGYGTESTVFLARHVPSHTFYAIKSIDLSLLAWTTAERSRLDSIAVKFFRLQPQSFCSENSMVPCSGASSVMSVAEPPALAAAPRLVRPRGDALARDAPPLGRFVTTQRGCPMY